MPSRVLRGLHRAEDLLLALLLGALLLLGVAQIVLRVVFDSGLDWAEPVSRSGVLWLALLGALGATRDRKHIAMDALPLLVPDKLRPWLWWIAQGAAAVVCGMLAWYGWGMVGIERDTPSVFVAGIPSWWPMLAFPLGFALMAVRFVAAAFAGPPEPGA